jgi:hypothetical protein
MGAGKGIHGLPAQVERREDGCARVLHQKRIREHKNVVRLYQKSHGKAIMNIFRKYIGEGKIRDKTQLKRYFWRLARKLHPDSASPDAAEHRFIRLKNDFDEAVEALPDKADEKQVISSHDAAADRDEIKRLFVELIECGFPVDIRIRGNSKLYVRRITEITRLFSPDTVPGVESFGQVEKEAYLIRGGNIHDNPLFGKIRMILYNIASCRYYPTEHMLKAVETWFAEIRPELRQKGFLSFCEWLKWLIEDLRREKA